MPEWMLVVTTLGSVNKTFLEGLDLELTRRLNGGTTVKFGVEARDQRAAEISVGDRAVKVYRNQVLRFHGRIWEPLTWKGNMIEVVCECPWAHVENRRVHATGHGQATYTGMDAGAIAWDLIYSAKTDTTGLGAGATPIRIRQGAIATSVSRNRTYEMGKPIGEAIRELANVINGFYFRVDPVDAVPGTQGELVILYPSSGSTRAGVRLEFGEGTFANLRDYSLEQALPRNQIRARGMPGAEFAANDMHVEVQDQASITAYDLFEDEVSFPTVSETSTLTQHANEALQSTPFETYQLSPAANAPMLWDAFDVGDVVNFRIVNGVLTKSGTGRVVEVTVQVSNGGAETLSNIVLQRVS